MIIHQPDNTFWILSRHLQTMGYILLHNLHSFGIWFITFLFQLRLLLRRLNHERLYTPHSCRKWQDQNDNFQILVVLQLQFEALIDIEIWGLGYLWEQRFTIVSPQKCLIRKELAYVDCWAQSLLSPLADTVKCKCQRHLTVFMLQIDVSRCV